MQLLLKNKASSDMSVFSSVLSVLRSVNEYPHKVVSKYVLQ